jgi:hypothetical protein
MAVQSVGGLSGQYVADGAHCDVTPPATQLPASVVAPVKSKCPQHTDPAPIVWPHWLGRCALDVKPAQSTGKVPASALHCAAQAPVLVVAFTQQCSPTLHATPESAEVWQMGPPPAPVSPASAASTTAPSPASPEPASPPSPALPASEASWPLSTVLVSLPVSAAASEVLVSWPVSAVVESVPVSFMVESPAESVTDESRTLLPLLMVPELKPLPLREPLVLPLEVPLDASSPGVEPLSPPQAAIPKERPTATVVHVKHSASRAFIFFRTPRQETITLAWHHFPAET